MFASDILKVLYAPHKVFKEVVQKPRYLGPILVFVIVVALQSGFFYAQSQKIYYEQTSPSSDKLGTWTTNATLWTTSPAIAVTIDYLHYLNSTIYGNSTTSSSLQFAVSDAASFFLALPRFTAVECSPTAFQNLSMRVEQAGLQTVPSKVILTLYSISDANIYQTDLTSYFSNSSLIGSWNNITIAVGPDAANWRSSGSPLWANITGLRLDFTYPSNNNVTLRMTGLFFRGEFKTFEQVSVGGLAITILEQTVLSFVFEWLFLTAVAYVLIKVLKGTVVWKPLFVAFGLVLVVTAIQAAISIAATQTLPVVHSPIELQAGLPVEFEAINAAIAAQTATYTLITGVVQLITYVWIVGLGVFVVRAVQPEFSASKSIAISAAAFIITIILMALLGV